MDSPSLLSLFLGPFFLVTTLTAALLKARSATQMDRFWWFFCLFSLGFGGLITYLCFQESSYRMAALQKAQAATKERELKLQGLLEVTHAFANEKASLAQENVEKALDQVATFQKRATFFEDQVEATQDNVIQLEKRCEKLLAENALLVQEKERLIVESKEAAGLQESLSNLQEQKEKFLSEYIALEDQCVAQIKHINQLKAKEKQFHPYQEVRKQFEEKSAILDETRRELFELEGKYLALKKENEQRAFESGPELTMLIDHFQALEAKNEKIEEERQHLEDLVTLLSEKKVVKQTRKKAPPKGAKSKIKLEDLELVDLFSKKSLKN